MNYHNKERPCDDARENGTVHLCRHISSKKRGRKNKAVINGTIQPVTDSTASSSGKTAIIDILNFNRNQTPCQHVSCMFFTRYNTSTSQVFLGTVGGRSTNSEEISERVHITETSTETSTNSLPSDNSKLHFCFFIIILSLLKL